MAAITAIADVRVVLLIERETIHLVNVALLQICFLLPVTLIAERFPVRFVIYVDIVVLD
jgi:hypothetical protein